MKKKKIDISSKILKQFEELSIPLKRAPQRALLKLLREIEVKLSAGSDVASA